MEKACPRRCIHNETRRVFYSYPDGLRPAVAVHVTQGAQCTPIPSIKRSPSQLSPIGDIPQYRPLCPPAPPPPSPPTFNGGAAFTRGAVCGLALTCPPCARRCNPPPSAAPLLFPLWRLLHLAPASHGADQADGAEVDWRKGSGFSGQGCRQAGDQGQGRWQGRSQAPLPAWNGLPAGHPPAPALGGAAHQQAPLSASRARSRTRAHQRTALSSVGCSVPTGDGGG